MTGPEVETLLDKALSDEAFLTRLLSKPRETAREVGVALSEDEASTFTTMSADDIRAFAAEYRASTDPARRRAAC